MPAWADKVKRSLCYIPGGIKDEWDALGPERYLKDGRSEDDAIICSVLARILMVGILAFALWLVVIMPVYEAVMR